MKKPRSIKNQSVSLSCHDDGEKRTIAIEAKNDAMPAAQAQTLRDRLSEMIHWCG